MFTKGPKRRNPRVLSVATPCWLVLKGRRNTEIHFVRSNLKTSRVTFIKAPERGQDLSGAFRAAEWILLNVGVSFLGAVLGFLSVGDRRFVSGERECIFYQGAKSGKLASKGVKSGPPTSERRKRPCALNKIVARIPLERGLGLWFPFGKPPQIRKKRPKEAADGST